MMVKTQVNFLVDDELLNQIDSLVETSNQKYNSRTHFIILAIIDKLEKEKYTEQIGAM